MGACIADRLRARSLDLVKKVFSHWYEWKEAGVRGIPSPFIKIYKRGRDTPHPSLLPLLPMRKDFLGEVLVARQAGALLVAI
jgi:hypothetical protein